MTTKTPLQKILKGILHTEDKTNITMKCWEILNLKRRIDKYSERCINVAAHTQIFKQQKQVNGRTHHIPLNINIEC
jgi:hypothetical protein